MSIHTPNSDNDSCDARITGSIGLLGEILGSTRKEKVIPGVLPFSSATPEPLRSFLIDPAGLSRPELCTIPPRLIHKYRFSGPDGELYAFVGSEKMRIESKQATKERPKEYLLINFLRSMTQRNFQQQFVDSTQRVLQGRRGNTLHVGVDEFPYRVSPDLPTSDVVSVVRMYSRGVHDIGGLSSFPKLQHVEIRHSQIDDIGGLSKLSNLMEVTIENGNISDLTPLKNLTSLTTLSVTDNIISDIPDLSKLKNLEHVNLRRNRITDTELNRLRLRQLNRMTGGGLTVDDNVLHLLEN